MERIVIAWFPRRVTQAGILSATVENAYNAYLLPSRVRFPWQPPLGGDILQYDADGLLTKMGGFDIARDGVTGRVTGASDQTATVTCAHTSDGYLSGVSTVMGASGGAAWSVEYDSATKKIAYRADSINGASVGSFDYAYDGMGRLESVTRHETNAVLESYTYDSLGRRATGKHGESYAYNDDDQLVLVGTEGAAGHHDYTYSPTAGLSVRRWTILRS